MPADEPPPNRTAYPFRPLPPLPAVVLSYELVDTLLPRCDPGEWKLLCAVLRHQEAPTMSVSQLMAWTGITSRDGVHHALIRLLARGYLIREPAGTSFTYRPNLALTIDLDEPENGEPSGGRVE